MPMASSSLSRHLPKQLSSVCCLHQIPDACAVISSLKTKIIYDLCQSLHNQYYPLLLCLIPSQLTASKTHRFRP